MFLEDLRNRHVALRIVLTFMALVAAFAFQFPIQSEVPGEPFLLSLLTVIIAALMFGEGVGLFGAFLSCVLAALYFEPWRGLEFIETAHVVKIEFYALISVACATTIAGMGSALIAAQQSTERLTVAEHEKSILLEEVAHRVANNFAAVASLIRYQSTAVSDEKARSVLDDALAQVLVMARIHKRLRTTDGSEALDSKSSIQELCRDLESSVACGRNVSIVPVALSRELSPAQAVPLGLILNELVTNAVKYAFADGRRGRVRVAFGETAGRFILTVEDNGVGIAAKRHGGLGHQLTRALAAQLGGDLGLERTGCGSIARLEFPSGDAAARPLRQSPHLSAA
jgi:two-component sensor histidine kinase